MTNTQILAFILGYQGGTVHQIAAELKVTVAEVLDADDKAMQVLCRNAQAVFWKKGGINALLLKHLGRCVATLRSQWEDPDNMPEWLNCASGVHKIISESYPPLDTAA